MNENVVIEYKQEIPHATNQPRLSSPYTSHDKYMAWIESIHNILYLLIRKLPPDKTRTGNETKGRKSTHTDRVHSKTKYKQNNQTTPNDICGYNCSAATPE